jgi:hypothetical protein
MPEPEAACACKKLSFAIASCRDLLHEFRRRLRRSRYLQLIYGVINFLGGVAGMVRGPDGIKRLWWNGFFDRFLRRRTIALAERLMLEGSC